MKKIELLVYYYKQSEVGNGMPFLRYKWFNLKNGKSRYVYLEDEE